MVAPDLHYFVWFWFYWCNGTVPAISNRFQFLRSIVLCALWFTSHFLWTALEPAIVIWVFLKGLLSFFYMLLRKHINNPVCATMFCFFLPCNLVSKLSKSVTEWASLPFQKWRILHSKKNECPDWGRFLLKWWFKEAIFRPPFHGLCLTGMSSLVPK